MSERYCDICGKEIARIHIEGKGNFCVDCHNERMLAQHGTKNTYDYPKTIYVLEASGVTHPFEIEHVVLGSIVSWNASERNGDYHFRYISEANEDGALAASHFFKEIVEGVCTKTLAESDIPSPGCLSNGSKYLELKSKGTIRIIEDENNHYETAFEIDGQIFASEDIGKLVSSFPGFSIQYQIHDASDPVLKEDEYLVPVKITQKSLVEELEYAIYLHSERNSISYKMVSAFDEAIAPILDKLKVFAKCGDRKKALEAGKEMVRKLLEIDTDDDFFPEYHLQNIGYIVDPRGADKELKQLIASFYGR